MDFGTEEKTILHYAKKIREYCIHRDGCLVDCPFFMDKDNECYFERFPYEWPEVNLHE